VQGRARPGEAVDGDGAAECFHAVLQPEQAGSPDRIGPASPIVTDPDLKRVLGRLRLRGSQREGERDETLLGTVVQVALDPPARLVRSGNHACREAVSSARFSAFEIAVATSSVKEARRASVSGPSDCSSAEPAIMTPQRRPWTMMGAAARVRRSARRP
jgi:hypothetical protein